MSTIVLATNNPGKAREFEELFAGLPFNAVLQSKFQLPDVDETGLSFVENALLKARAASGQTGLPAIGDDSGLEVDALKGAPGIYSARFSGEGANAEKNNALLLEKLKDTLDEERTARFRCVLVYLRHGNDPMPLICEGTWEGKILPEPRGDSGFGYDPLFYVPTHQCSAAELPSHLKNVLSHRGQALRALRNRLNKL